MAREDIFDSVVLKACSSSEILRLRFSYRLGTTLSLMHNLVTKAQVVPSVLSWEAAAQDGPEEKTRL